MVLLLQKILLCSFVLVVHPLPPPQKTTTLPPVSPETIPSTVTYPSVIPTTAEVSHLNEVESKVDLTNQHRSGTLSFSGGLANSASFGITGPNQEQININHAVSIGLTQNIHVPTLPELFQGQHIAPLISKQPEGPSQPQRHLAAPTELQFNRGRQVYPNQYIYYPQYAQPYIYVPYNPYQLSMYQQMYASNRYTNGKK